MKVIIVAGLLGLTSTAAPARDYYAELSAIFAEMRNECGGRELCIEAQADIVEAAVANLFMGSEQPAEPARIAEPATPSAPASGSSFPNCKSARAAGYSRMRRGEPGYSAKLDRDDDGVACE